MSLFRRAVAVNAAVLVAAALLLALSPATVSSTVKLEEWLVLAAGTAVVIVVNLLLLRRVFGPLERLEHVMGRIDPHEPGRRIGVGDPDDEIARVSRAFNAMLDRLERERADSRRRALRAQEAERGRVARGLHDEVGQLLTGVVLQLEGLAATVPAARRGDVAGIQDNVREGVHTVREIARGLRPPALDEFGLRASLVALAVGFGERSGLTVPTSDRLCAPCPRRRDRARALPGRAGGAHERRSPCRRRLRRLAAERVTSGPCGSRSPTTGEGSPRATC